MSRFNNNINDDDDDDDDDTNKMKIFSILTAKLRTAIKIMPNVQIDTTETKSNPLSVEGRL